MRLVGPALAMLLIPPPIGFAQAAGALPVVDERALMASVGRLAEALRAEGERLVADEGGPAAIERLLAEADADETAAFERTNLAVIVACVAGAADVAAPEYPIPTDAEIPLALARHLILVSADDEDLRAASAKQLAWSADDGGTAAKVLRRFSTVLAGLERMAPDSEDLIPTLVAIGGYYGLLGDGVSALAFYARALELEARLAPESPGRIEILDEMIRIHALAGDPGSALPLAIERLRLIERLAPDTLAEAEARFQAGSLCIEAGDCDAAATHLEASLAIVARDAPDAPELAMVLDAAGAAHRMRGDLATALERHEAARALLEGAGADPADLACALSNVGLVQLGLGDVDLALKSYYRAFEIRRSLAPRSAEVADSLNGIAAAYIQREDPESALSYLNQAEALTRELEPDSHSLAWVLNNLGVVHRARGDLARALRCMEESLVIKRRLAPDSLDVALSLNGIGNLRRLAGDLEGSLDCFEEARALERALDPDGLGEAQVFANIGRVRLAQGDLAEARRWCDRGLAAMERLAPWTPACAAAHRDMGAIGEAEGRPEDAAREYERAAAIVERARERSATDNLSRARFAERYTPVYHDLIRVLRQLGRDEAAADASERLRARAFLDAVAERGLAAGALSPGFVSRQGVLDACRDRLTDELWGLGDAIPDAERREEIADALVRIESEQESLEREARSEDPRYAAFRYPEPMAVSQLRREIGGGTVVLSYIVGADATWLFVFGERTETSSYEIAVGRPELERRIRALLSAARGGEAWEAEARALGDLLLAPAADALRGAERVLVLPDGPLWLLPLHALPPWPDAHLCGALPVTYASSATVAVESRVLASGGPPRPLSMLAVGDPDFTHAEAPSGEDADARIARLPYTGVEVGAIAAALGGGVDVRLGPMASEEGVRSGCAGKRLVHLASHGLLDAASALDSAILLSAPAEEADHTNDGCLKAREALGLDLSACDLVTLSACESGRGEVLSGEGVIGLTRAFLYAGAASVLCTQWSVADDSSAALMVRFYEHYRAGEPKDVSLREAMLEIRTGKLADGSALQLPAPLVWRDDWSHAYHWAPFMLVGEWRQTGDAAQAGR